MKKNTKHMTKQERINSVYKWLKSNDCYYKALYPQWRLVYILSLIFGKLGIRLVVNKIRF